MAYCSLENENSRVLEVPLWMLDVAACSKTQVCKLGVVSTDSLRELKQVLESAKLRAQAPTSTKLQKSRVIEIDCRLLARPVLSAFLGHHDTPVINAKFCNLVLADQSVHFRKLRRPRRGH